MAAKKPALKTFSATATFSDVQVYVDVEAEDLAKAVEEAKKLKFLDFITPKGEVSDYTGPEITSIWKN